MVQRLSRSHWRVSAGLALAGLAMLSGCSRQEAPKEPVRAVKLLTVGSSMLQAQAEYSGEIRARVETRLGFRVPGKLVQRHVEAGQRVGAGQLLAQIDPQDYQLAAGAAQAGVAAAQSQRDLTLADYRRFEALRNQGFISAAELERRESALQAAEAALKQAQAQFATQNNQAAYARLLSSASGVVTGIEAEAGQVVAAGQPVIRLAHDGPRDAVFAVPEQLVTSLQPGQPLMAQLPGTGQSLKGRVREIAAAADPVTRTFQVKLALDASDKLPLGVTVNVQMPKAAGAQTTAPKLPTTALRQDGQDTAVWVLDEAGMTVQSRKVTVQTIDGQEAVIATGLRPGEKVVAVGVHVLSPGQKVTVYAPAGAAAK